MHFKTWFLLHFLYLSIFSSFLSTKSTSTLNEELKVTKKLNISIDVWFVLFLHFRRHCRVHSRKRQVYNCKSGESIVSEKSWKICVLQFHCVRSSTINVVCRLLDTYSSVIAMILSQLFLWQTHCIAVHSVPCMGMQCGIVKVASHYSHAGT